MKRKLESAQKVQTSVKDCFFRNINYKKSRDSWTQTVVQIAAKI